MKMIPNQLFPLEINPQTQEPFLRLRKHKNIVLTPMRMEDAQHLPPLFNDPRVYQWLMATPYPYTLDDAVEFISQVKPLLDAILQELKDAQGSQDLEIVGGSPVGSIREVLEDGTDIYLGFIEITRCLQKEVLDTETLQSNEKLEVGNPNIIWDFGDYLAPSHHGKGIMTDAVDTLLHEWAIPRMNVRNMFINVFVGNQASVRVFEKNGFVMTRTIEAFSEARGEMKGLHVLEWRLKNNVDT